MKIWDFIVLQNLLYNWFGVYFDVTLRRRPFHLTHQVNFLINFINTDIVTQLGEMV